jgi:hypothetical protein
MYIPSNTPLLEGQRESAARNLACETVRTNLMRQTSAAGRARAFETIVDPNSVLNNQGVGTAVNVQKLQDQTAVSRASGLAGNGQSVDAGRNPSVQQIIRNAPEVVSLNRGGSCQLPGQFERVPLPVNPQPGMPHRAPNIQPTPNGPMFFEGASSTIPGDYTRPAPTAMVPYQSPLSQPTNYTAPAVPTVYAQILPPGGMSGIAPAWGDAWVEPDPTQAGSWLADNWGWLVVAGLAVYALSEGRKR